MFHAYFLSCCKNLSLNLLPNLFILVQITVFGCLGMAAMEDMEDMEDMEVDTEAMVDTVERGKLMLRLTVMVDMEDMVVDMAVTDMEADTTFKQIFHQHNYVRVLDPIRFIIFN